MKIICFANQKGGCGKSTLLVVFAAYLKKRLNKEIVVIDADMQQTVLDFYKKECKLTDNKPLFNVAEMKVENLSKSLENIDRDKDSILIIDTSNQLNEGNFRLLKYVDHIIIPYNMSQSSILSTTIFFDVYKKYYREDSKLIFLANAIKTTTKKNQLEEFQAYLRKDLVNGFIIKEYIKDTVEMQKVQHLNVNDVLLSIIEEPLKELAECIGITKN